MLLPGRSLERKSGSCIRKANSIFAGNPKTPVGMSSYSPACSSVDGDVEEVRLAQQGLTVERFW
jgi:hypothetical protein